jgi:hypothetical protein
MVVTRFGARISAVYEAKKRNQSSDFQDTVIRSMFML